MDVTMLYDDSGVYGFFCKGHVPKDLFLKEIANEWLHDNLCVEDVEYMLARKVPDTTGDKRWMFIEKCKVGKGAFKATFINVDGRGGK